MTTTQSSSPYSLRLPHKLSQLVDLVAKKIGKPAPDTIRAGIELAFANEYRFMALEATNADRANTLRTLRGAAAEPTGTTRLPMPVYSALMYLLHWAYLHGPHGDNANPRYVFAMLDVIGGLITLREKMQITNGSGHARNCMGIKDDEDLSAGMLRIQKDIQKNGLHIGYAEMLTRPLEAMADDLQYLDSTEVAHIFAPHLKTLLPVAVSGSKMGIDETIIRRDIHDLLPSPENFSIDTLKWVLQGEVLALVVAEGHHTNAFGSSAVLGLYAAIESGTLDKFLGPDIEFSKFSRRDFALERMGSEVIMHANAGYRLVLSVLEVRELSSNIARAFEKPEWRRLVTRYRELAGDI